MTEDDVLAIERAYVAAVHAQVASSSDERGLGPALAAAGAVASHHLAIGAPRSFAIVGAGSGAREALAAHRTWFQPRDLRCTEAALGLRVVPLAEALAADIVCICEPLALAARDLRRGTHVNALADVTLDDDLRRIAMITDEPHGLPALAAGLVDGRKLDEITIFVAGAASIAHAAWHARCSQKT